jgi:hypothetical protein
LPPDNPNRKDKFGNIPTTISGNNARDVMTRWGQVTSESGIVYHPKNGGKPFYFATGKHVSLSSDLLAMADYVGRVFPASSSTKATDAEKREMVLDYSNDWVIRHPLKKVHQVKMKFLAEFRAAAEKKEVMGALSAYLGVPDEAEGDGEEDGDEERGAPQADGGADPLTAEQAQAVVARRSKRQKTLRTLAEEKHGVYLFHQFRNPRHEDAEGLRIAEENGLWTRKWRDIKVGKSGYESMREKKLESAFDVVELIDWIPCKDGRHSHNAEQAFHTRMKLHPWHHTPASGCKRGREYYRVPVGKEYVDILKKYLQECVDVAADKLEAGSSTD